MKSAARFAYRSVRTTANRVRGFGAGRRSRAYYVIEPANWSIRWDGHYISRGARSAGVDCRVTTYHRGIRDQVVHFGSRNLFIHPSRHPNIERMHDSNAVAFTWFHGDPEIDDASDGYAALLSGAADAADLVVTSSTLGAGVLKRYGVPDRKVRTIPLGVDTQHFKPSSRAEREATRESLEIPSDALCIGSFQKDGVGWGDGMQPKRVKGPDVFLETIGMLRDRFPIHVLLTGPARGYLKDGLGKLGVPFSHVYLKDFTEIPAYYGALDLYLVTSRDEGGPKGVLESMATGTPLVTTRVGMAPDIVVSGENGFMTESEDVDFLTERAGQLLESAGLREQFASKGLQTSAQYDWQTIGERYASDVYRPLMAS